jgi:hypothetical protein
VSASLFGRHAVAAVLLVSACDVDAPLRRTVDFGDATTSAAGLRGGTPIEPESPFAAIALGRLVDVDGALRCTAMAIAPRHVLTARHCVPSDQSLASLLDERTVGFVERGQDVVLPVVAIQRHPTLDVAVLSLGASVRGMPIVDTTSPRHDDVVTIAGAGIGTPSENVVATGRFRIDTVDTDFFTVSGTDGAGLCPGDSGGPILLERNDAWALVGVHIRGFLDCSGPSTAVRADGLAVFSDDAIAISPPDSQPCDDDDAAYCLDDHLRRCVLGTWRTIDCSAVSHACVDGEDGPRCEPIPCGDVSAAGRCEESLARACIGGTLWERDCANEPGQGCALDADTGRFGCVACEACDGVCVDLSTDRNRCGTCSHACAVAERCVDGECVASTQRTDDPGVDVDPDTPNDSAPERPHAPVGCAGEAAWGGAVLVLRRRRRSQ